MSDEAKIVLPRTRAETEFIQADADYFHTKARQCFRMARCADSEARARTLRSLGNAFEAKARSLDAD